MKKSIEMTEKYERNNWPSIPRPDVKPPDGWSLEAVTTLKRVRNHQLSPDGKQIAFIWDSDDLSDVYVMPAEGGWPGRLSTDRGPTLSWNDEIPQWSPDSRTVAFTSKGQVYTVDAAGGLPKKLTDYVTSTWGPHWMPDSQYIIIGLERHDADQLAITDLSGKQLRMLTNAADGDHWDPRSSPDGKSVAFVFRRYDDINRTDICIVDVETSEIRTVYGQSKTRAWAPRWSPDGEWLAFISQQSGHDDIWLAHPDGTGLRQVTELGLDIVEFAWAPNGKNMACTVNRGGSFELGILTVKTGNVEIIRDTPGVHTNPNWSPGGVFVTFEFESPTQFPDLYRIHTATGLVTQLTFSTPPWLAATKPVMPESVSYTSFDGLEIPAFLYKPEKPNRAAIVWVHGGPSAQYNLSWEELVSYLVAKGYTILAPNYRGTTGYGVEFEHRNYGDWGGGDTQDCLYAADYLKTIPGLDPSRFAIMGGSYGGYMTDCCLALDSQYRYACGIAKYGDADLVNSWALCSRPLRYYTEIFLGHPAKNREAYIKGSPVLQAEKIQKPMLIMHGLLDDIVPPEASEEWVEALKRHGKTYEYKTYPNEPHGFVHRAETLDAYQRIEQFLDWYLLP
jgi:dipeptidyl aminopeptidase/acylaminoacyl peptidase